MSKIFLSAVAALLMHGLAFAAGTPVDINTADAQALASSLNGVGPAKAQAIIDYRDENGPFKSAEDLALVKGIGERTVALNAEMILVSAPKPGAAKPKQ